MPTIISKLTCAMETSLKKLHVVLGVIIGKFLNFFIVKNAESFRRMRELVVASVIRVSPLLFMFFI